MTQSGHRVGQRGMTLIEMVIALAVFSAVMAAALSFLRSESRAFNLGTERLNTAQNLRFAVNLLEQDLRTAGAGVPDEQPFLVYAGRDVVAFNADYTTNVKNDVFAVYYDPDAATGEVTALTRAQRVQIPNTLFTYPDTTYILAGVNSPAETIIFFFRPDSLTARADDYGLFRQVNGRPAELVARNLLQTPGLPLFQYYRLVTPQNGPPRYEPVADALLPLVHTLPIHLSPGDTGVAGRIDSVRAVQINVTGTNGLTGAAERQRVLSRLVRFPNAGLANRRTCGDEPLLGSALVATPGAGSAGEPIVTLAWNAATDETGGEKDVVRYVIWRRLQAAPDWGDPYLSIPAGNANYAYVDGAVNSGDGYVYALAAQDCTPGLSQLAISNTVAIP